MSIQIKSDRKETENKTIRFPVDMLARIDAIMVEHDVSFSGFVLQACEYVLDELENPLRNIFLKRSPCSVKMIL